MFTLHITICMISNEVNTSLLVCAAIDENDTLLAVAMVLHLQNYPHKVNDCIWGGAFQLILDIVGRKRSKAKFRDLLSEIKALGNSIQTIQSLPPSSATKNVLDSTFSILVELMAKWLSKETSEIMSAHEADTMPSGPKRKHSSPKEAEKSAEPASRHVWMPIKRRRS